MTVRGRSRLAAVCACAALLAGCSTDDPGDVWLPVDYDQPKVSVGPDGHLSVEVAIASTSPNKATKQVKFDISYETRIQHDLDKAQPDDLQRCDNKVPGNGQYNDQCAHQVTRGPSETVTLAPGEKWVHSIRLSDLTDRDNEACVEGSCRGIVRMTYKNSFKNSPSVVASQEICWEAKNPTEVVQALNPDPKLGNTEGGYFAAPQDRLCEYYGKG